ncbi:MAG: reverse transcriptase N-terminal domain-containing protein [Deltaproteobacteria bacterium]|uniref:reverse transcriptase N-terminal domain-containing protein n=1 Tax=Desulfobacula sp. TaxID=2593537 RepID=UPI0019A1CB4F|nr:reverse transcriptase N-terminal domain-containing protein [Candidatus Desulfobacula maris]MBL6995835.1 reverse transcriptase N-terminal domain-containing protein [Desulfobacula sp.]
MQEKANAIRIFVKRLQMRIAKAVKEKRYGRVKALQWLLTKKKRKRPRHTNSSGQSVYQS